MARSKVRIEFNRAALLQLMQTDLVSDRAAAVADACNAESSWGGYHHETEITNIRARARVWVESGGPNEDGDRANRLIRNLGAGG